MKTEKVFTIQDLNDTSIVDLAQLRQNFDGYFKTLKVEMITEFNSVNLPRVKEIVAETEELEAYRIELDAKIEESLENANEFVARRLLEEIATHDDLTEQLKDVLALGRNVNIAVELAETGDLNVIPKVTEPVKKTKKSKRIESVTVASGVISPHMLFEGRNAHQKAAVSILGSDIDAIKEETHNKSANPKSNKALKALHVAMGVTEYVVKYTDGSEDRVI